MATMDVDNNNATSIKMTLHPLAIVSMADQYTRITLGGTPMDRTEPVVGLLFGNNSDDGMIQICDAVEIPSFVENCDAIVALHQAVYAQQRVVGCYRVVPKATTASMEPTAHDVVRTQATHVETAIFLLLQVKPQGAFVSGSPPPLRGEMPITIFQLHQGGALVHEPDWRLDTAVPEKIAVERVMREQSSNNHQELAATTQLYHSVGAFQERMAVIEQYLSSNEKEVPKDPTLLRKIQVLVLKSRLLNKKSSVPMPLLQELKALAVLAETVNHGRLYTSKMEKSESSSSGMRGRRNTTDRMRALRK